MTTNAQFMGLPVEYLGGVPQNLGDMVTDPAAQRRNQAIYNYLKGNRKRTQKTYGLGAKLPSIGGLRLKRKVNTKYGVRDVITDGNGMVFGYANPAAQLAIGRTGKPGSQYIGLTRRGAKPVPLAPTPAASGGAAGGATGKPSTAPGLDEFSGYGDYPMIATYLRGLQQQEKNFAEDWKTNILPGVSGGLQNIANIGANIAAQYGGSVGTGTGGGYVTNAYNTGAGIAPAQVAGGLGGVTQTYNPNVQAAGSAGSSAAGMAAAANSRYNTLLAAATPVSATQGILAGLTSQAANISKSYADKRLSERLKLDQWIVEQKAAKDAQDTKDAYNEALLKMSGLELSEKKRGNLVNEGIAQTNAETARINANNAGQMTDNEIATSAQGFVKAPRGAGPKSQAIIDKTKIVSRDGTTWYRPNKPGKGGGASGALSSQNEKAAKAISGAYYGEKYDVTGAVISTQPGINRLATAAAQGQRIASIIGNMVSSGEISKSSLKGLKGQDFIRGLVQRALAQAHTYGEEQAAMSDADFVILLNTTINALNRRGVFK